MTLLELIQKVAARTGVPSPVAVVSSTDKQVMQLLGLLEELLEDLVMEPDWSPITREATFVTIAQESQGSLSILAPDGFKFILGETIFNRTSQLPLYGPLSASKWQSTKATTASGPLHSYRIVRRELLFSPVPSAGDTCAFEYASSHAVLAVDGITTKIYPTADDDTFLLDDTLLIAGLRWKWKYEKGLEYAEDFARYEAMKANLKGNDGAKGNLNLNSCADSIRPGVLVAPGSWNL